MLNSKIEEPLGKNHDVGGKSDVMVMLNSKIEDR